MKEKFKARLNLTPNKLTSPVILKTIVIRELQGFREIEDDLLFDRLSNPETADKTKFEISNLSKKHFGIDESETDLPIPESYWLLEEDSPERTSFDLQWDHWEENFETSEIGDEKDIELLLKLNIDFRDEHGYPMRLTKYFTRQAEAAAKGIKGKLPDLTVIDADVWERNMEKAAENFSAMKKKSA